MHGLFDPGHLRACPCCIRSERDNPGLSWVISGSFGAWAGIANGPVEGRLLIGQQRPSRGTARVAGLGRRRSISSLNANGSDGGNGPLAKNVVKLVWICLFG
jgi:hypothetical protein